MSFKINMQECYPTHDSPVIRTKTPWAEITIPMIEQACRAMRYSVGDHILVQSLDHEKTTLLAEREFRVVSVVSKIERVTKDDMTEQAVEKIQYEVEPWGEWSLTRPGKELADSKDAKQTRKAA